MIRFIVAIWILIGAGLVLKDVWASNLSIASKFAVTIFVSGAVAGAFVA